MKFIKDVSIKRKLTRIIMLTSSVSLLLACGGFGIIEMVHFQNAVTRELSGLASIIGRNSVAPLEFNDTVAGRENLRGLMADSRIVAAGLYDKTGAVFAFYTQAGKAQTSIPERPLPDGKYQKEGYLSLYHPILLDKKRIGTIYIQADLESMYDQFKVYGLVASLVLAGSLLISFFLSSKLQATVSDPILELTNTAQRISAEENYSIRTVKQSEDEIGVLIEQFNEMLDQIQQRDEELGKARDDLEVRVKERTRELETEIFVRKRAEEKLLVQTDELKRSNKELEDFALIASHDLQDPLRKVMAFSTRLKDSLNSDLNEKNLDYLNRMQNSTLRMQALINDLLKLSRVTTQAKPFQHLDLNKIVAGVVDDLEVRIKQSGGSVSFANLPTVRADENQMRQLFQNLIANALKFQKEGSTPEIKLTSRNLGDKSWEIRVADNGIGFDLKHHDRIFQPFERLHGKSSYEGTGMGLAICQKIAVRHGGSITAQSETDKGTTFIINLPA